VARPTIGGAGCVIVAVPRWRGRRAASPSLQPVENAWDIPRSRQVPVTNARSSLVHCSCRARLARLICVLVRDCCYSLPQAHQIDAAQIADGAACLPSMRQRLAGDLAAGSPVGTARWGGRTVAQRATASIRPEPLALSSACGHGSPGWGETPLARMIGRRPQAGRGRSSPRPGARRGASCQVAGAEQRRGSRRGGRAVRAR